jgi:hypothetical protein
VVEQSPDDRHDVYRVIAAIRILGRSPPQ